MKRWWDAFILSVFVAVVGLSAPQEPEVQIVDEKVSINVDSITLGRLLRLLDQATGMKSTVPPQLANKEVTVRFSGLTLDQAVRKIFESQSMDYVFIPGRGIVVTRPSEPTRVAEQPPPVNQEAPQVTDQLNMQSNPQVLVQVPLRPPPIVPTPFGPIVNPRGQQLVQLPPIPGETIGPPFFAPLPLNTPPAGSPNGPAYNNLFAPISIYQDPTLPRMAPRLP